MVSVHRLSKTKLFSGLKHFEPRAIARSFRLFFFFGRVVRLIVRRPMKKINQNSMRALSGNEN
jgi:hypothetical protein